MITGYTTSASGPLTLVTVTSSLTGIVCFNWFVDGEFAIQTNVPEFSFAIQSGQQATIVCIDSNSSTIPTAPAGWPSTRTLLFVRSLDPTIQSYQIQQQENGGSWVTLASIPDDPTQWSFVYQTGPLDDLASYVWQAVPIGQNGNSGTPIALAAEFIVRTPNAPLFVVTADSSSPPHLVFAA